MGIYIVALALGAVLPILIQKLFIRFKKFDDFNHRSSHNTLATRTGGISVYFILFGITIYQYALGEEIFDFSLLIPLSIMFVIGVYDDLYNADFKLKFLMQIIVGKVLIDQGYVITNYHGLFGLQEIPWILAQITTIFVFLIIVNAFNFIDGIDGLAKSQFFKTSFLFLFFSNFDNDLESLIIIIMLSTLPLFFYNFKKKEKVFLGDGGSMFLGTIIAFMVLYILGPEYAFKNNYTINKTLFSIMVVLYPLVDLLRVFISRVLNKRSPFEADKNHIHHLILNKFSHQGLSTAFILALELIIIFPIIIILKS